jgi:hypothetical protein
MQRNSSESWPSDKAQRLASYPAWLAECSPVATYYGRPTRFTAPFEARPNGKLTGEQVDAVIKSAMDREHHLTFEVGRRADWANVLQSARGFR